jgi:hypothetical protein
MALPAPTESYRELTRAQIQDSKYKKRKNVNNFSL